MNIVVDDLMSYYELSGKGKLVLLLHGWGDNSKGLAALQKHLSTKHQVLSVDLPGFGASEPPKTAWNLDDYANFLASFLAKLKLGQPYAVVGHSNGGALAIRSIALGKLQSRKLVLIAASGIRSGTSVKRIFLILLAKVGNVATLWMPDRYRRALRRSLYQTAGSDMLVVPHLEEIFKQTVRQDVQEDATKLTVPTLLIYGAHDKAVPLEYGRRYQALIPNTQFEEIPAAGHFVHLEEPGKVNKLIDEFLR